MNEMGALTKRTKPKTTRMKEVSPEKQRLIELSVGSNGVNGSPSSTTVAALVIPSSHFNCAAASSQSDGSNRRIWLRRAWGIHFLIAVTVLTVGIVDNHQSRKYLPINPSLVEGEECVNAYLNVMAPSEADEDAVICCENSTSDSGRFAFLETGICSSKSEMLPFASRLAKFPDAWLLPLFPILLRILYWLYMSVVSFSIATDQTSTISISYALKRLCLYILLLNFRGWILYVLFNELEDQFVSSMSIDQAATTTATCWYSDGWLQPEQEACVGRAFDFSDHVVLFYAQILPIALIETLYSFQFPYWVSELRSHQSSNKAVARIPQLLFPIILAVSHVYLQFITATGAYKTAAFFHTPGEVVAGFLVSLVVTVPLLLLQCSNRWAAWRSFFFRY